VLRSSQELVLLESILGRFAELFRGMRSAPLPKAVFSRVCAKLLRTHAALHAARISKLMFLEYVPRCFTELESCDSGPVLQELNDRGHLVPEACFAKGLECEVLAAGWRMIAQVPLGGFGACRKNPHSAKFRGERAWLQSICAR
jgi:hypothetical protein